MKFSIVMLFLGGVLLIKIIFGFYEELRNNQKWLKRTLKGLLFFILIDISFILSFFDYVILIVTGIGFLVTHIILYLKLYRK